MRWRWPSWLRPLILGRAAGSDRLLIVLYSRRGCHLCDDAAALLASRQSRYGFDLRQLDVDSDVALVAKFGECVPVVTVNGKVRFRGQVAPALLDRLLVGESLGRDR